MDSANRETEAKFLIRDLIDAQARLIKLEARLLQSRVHEINLRFDTPERSLRQAGRVLRLRQDRDARLTFKGAASEIAGALSRVEIELTVESFDRARQFIEALGYQEIFRYEKFRTTFQLEHAQIMLDELPFGTFIEIEGALEILEPIARRMGLRWDRAVGASYHELFERACANRGINLHELTFENFSSLIITPADLESEYADAERTG